MLDGYEFCGFVFDCGEVCDGWYKPLARSHPSADTT